MKKALLSVIFAFAVALAAGAVPQPGPGDLIQALDRLYRLDWAQAGPGQVRTIWPGELVCSVDARENPEGPCDGTLMLSSAYFVRDGDCFACDTLVFSRRSVDGRCAEMLISVTISRFFDSQASAWRVAQSLLSPLREMAAKDETFYQETWRPVGKKSAFWWQRIPLSSPGGEKLEVEISETRDGWLLHLYLGRNPSS